MFMAWIGKPDCKLPENARCFNQPALCEGFRKALDTGKDANNRHQLCAFGNLFVKAVRSFFSSSLSFFDKVVSKLSIVSGFPEGRRVLYNHPIAINKD
jgi:hypothetical protein